MKRSWDLLAEALRMAKSQPVATTVTAMIVAAAVGVIVSTTGQTVAIERDVLGRIDDAGTRTIVVEDLEGRAGLDAGTVERVEALEDVEWAIGFGSARDVRPGGLDGAAPVPLRGYVGELPPVVTTTPWAAKPGTALAGVDAISALGFATAAGPTQQAGSRGPELSVVGWLTASSPLEFLDGALLTVADREEPVVRIVVLAGSAEQVPHLANAIRAVLNPTDPNSVAVRTSDALVQVRAAIQGELGVWSRNLVVLVLGACLVLTALNVFGAVSTRRRDFGRRRALGATRRDIVVLITAQTVATALVGAAVGIGAGMLIVQQLLDVSAAADFSIAVGVLAVVATAIAALPPAVVAAYRDPVRILRVA